MDKEIADLAPETLQGVEVNTVKHSSEEDAQAAAAIEKEKKENYYVDPLEQDAVMKEKLAKVEAEKERMRKEYGLDEDDAEKDTYIDSSIRPDMNVSGYFSAGNTAKKESFVARPASKGLITFSAFAGFLVTAYSLIYTVIMVIDRFMSPHWLMNWFFIILIIISIFNIYNGVRTMKAQNKHLKSMALISIMSSSIIIVPIIAWIIHIITG